MLEFNQRLKAVHQSLVSSAETKGTFNKGSDTIDLHRPTQSGWSTATPHSAKSTCEMTLSFVPHLSFISPVL
jgi:hypothetical protein